MKLSLFAMAATATARTTHKDLESSKYQYSLDQLIEEFDLSISEKDVAYRRQVLAKNIEKIRLHNTKSGSSYKMGVNQFAHLTPAEFGKQMRGYKRGRQTNLFEAADLSSHVASTDLPDSVDWREKGVVTPAKNQGGCGSCWAFSATETVESNVAINTGKLLKLAPQEYVSCAPNPDQCGGTGGCEGSTQWLAFNYSVTEGLALEETYPYRGTDSECAPSKETPAVTIDGYKRLPANNYTALMNAVVSVGPIAISAAAEPWQLYEEGVYDGRCGADVDHAIQLVGYGKSEKTVFKKAADYWLVRNSWGGAWGEKGYIRIERFGDTPAGETCYTDRTPQDGTECKDGPKTEQVCGLCGLMSDSSYVTGGALKTTA
jgi:cathepsin L